MDEVYIYYADLPDGINEMVCPCADGYTVYLDSGQSREGMIKAYKHAMDHIRNRDFEKTNVQEIEMRVRKGNE